MFTFREFRKSRNNKSSAWAKNFTDTDSTDIYQWLKT